MNLDNRTGIAPAASACNSAPDNSGNPDRQDFSSLPDPCTSVQLAAALGKSAKTIVDWCQERAYTHIPCFRLGNRWYHRPAELIRWLNGIKSGQVEFRRKPRNSAERR